jgi:hypothetical protein
MPPVQPDNAVEAFRDSVLRRRRLDQPTAGLDHRITVAAMTKSIATWRVF